MRLFIRVENNQPVDHPVTEENIKSVFPDIDIDNLPENWMPFERISQPIPGVYEVVEHAGYLQDGNIIKDSWNIRSMTAEEKLKKQEAVKTAWVSMPGRASWIFDEVTCRFNPPIPYPTDGNAYVWDDTDQGWRIIPPPPLVEAKPIL